MATAPDFGNLNGPGPGVSTPTSLEFPATITGGFAAASPVMNELRTVWRKVDLLWGGTDSMRLAGTELLPKEVYETDEEYKARLQRSTLVNYYKNTIQDAAGRVFAKDVTLESAASVDTDGTTVEQPAQVEFLNFEMDVDAYGNNLTQFSKAVFEQAVNHGVGFILVDYPRVPVESLGSLEKQVESGSRPYWVHVPANRVLDCRSALIAGKQRMSLFKYEETIHELASDGMTPATFQQVRVFKHQAGSVPMYAVYRREINAVATASTNLTWTLIEAGVLTNADGAPLPGIPVAPVYTNRLGYGIGKPALEDLADLNITHYQFYSDYININHLTNVPFLFGKGIKSELDENGKKIPFILSPGRAFTSDIETAEISWVEHTGASIASAKAALDDMVTQMKECGLKLTQEVAPQGRSATEALLNTAESNSRLKSMALSLQDALNLALFYTSQFLGIPDMTRADVSTEFADVLANTSDSNSLLEAYKENAIDAETLIYEFQRRNILDPCKVVSPPEVPEPVVVEPTLPVTTNTEAMPPQE